MAQDNKTFADFLESVKHKKGGGEKLDAYLKSIGMKKDSERGGFLVPEQAQETPEKLITYFKSIGMIKDE